MRKEKTNRGFSFRKFKDANGVECSMQKSSLATKDCIWLGCEEIGLKHFKAGSGGKNVPKPFSYEEHWVANNRMHLTRAQVKKLLPYLQKLSKK